MTGRERVLDLCDALWRERSVRDAAWPWLRDEIGQLFVADAWWREVGVAAVVADSEPYTVARLTPILRTLDAHDIRALPLWPALWEQAGGLDGLRDSLLGDAGLAQLRQLWGLSGASVPAHFGYSEAMIVDTRRDPDREAAATNAQRDADLCQLEQPRPKLVLGWRTRPILLALLGAAALARRSAGSATEGIAEADPGHAALQMEILGVLALFTEDHPEDWHDLAVSGLPVPLAANGWEVEEAVRDMLERGLAAQVHTHETDDMSLELTHKGSELLAEWLQRCEPLVGVWPPDREGVDDTT